MDKESNKEIVIKFIHAINNHNIDEIVNLMSEDHVFVDAIGNKFIGKNVMKEGWKRYYEMFPDYKIEIVEITDNESIIDLFGFASATYKNLKHESNSNFWRIPASWKAVIMNNEITHWQVYCDYTKINKIIDRS